MASLLSRVTQQLLGDRRRSPAGEDNPGGEPGTTSGSGCPFGFGAAAAPAFPASPEPEAERAGGLVSPPPLPPPLFGQKKVMLLYEQYIHLPALRDVRTCPASAAYGMDTLAASVLDASI